MTEEKYIELLRMNFGLGYRHAIQQNIFLIEQTRKDCIDDLKVLDYLEEILRAEKDQYNAPNSFGENYLKLVAYVKRQTFIWISEDELVNTLNGSEIVKARLLLKEIGEI
jgi:hypothetical protein